MTWLLLTRYVVLAALFAVALLLAWSVVSARE